MPQINVRWADNTAELAKNLKGGVQQIEATKNAVAKLTQSLSGENLINAAQKYARAVEQIGGAGKLTAANQERVNSIMKRAVEQMEAAGTGGSALANHFRELADATKKVEAPTSALSTWLGTLSSTLVGTAAGFVSAQAVMNGASTAWHTLTGFVADSVKSYAAAEAAQVKLTAALRAQGLATPAVVGQYKDLSDQFQRTTVFSDDLITEMQALLVQVGNVMPSQMELALDAATNLASGLGIDLETATTLVAKAAAGHTETLGRYGITVDQAAVKTKGLDAVLQAINQQFGGQAAAQLDTYAGRVQQMANNWDNLKEAIGRVLVNSPLTEASLRTLNESVSGLEDGTTKSSHSISGLVKLLGLPISPAFIAFLETWADSANKAAEAQERLNKFQALNKPVASHETETDRQEKAARDLAAARKLQAERDAEAAKAAEAYAKALEAVNKKIRDGEAPITALSEAQQRLILHYRELKLSNEEIALKMRLTVRTVEDFTDKTDAAAAAVKGLKDAVLSGPIAGLRLYDATKDVEELQKFIDKLKAIEDGTFRPKVDPSILTGPIPGLPVFKPVIADADTLRKSISDLAQAFATLSQISGGALGGFLRAIGQSIGEINIAREAMKTWGDATASLVTKLSSVVTIVGVIYETGMTLLKLGDQFTSGLSINGVKTDDLLKAQQILKDFLAQFGDTNKAAIDALHDKLVAAFTATGRSIAEADALWEEFRKSIVKGGDAATAVIRKIQAALAAAAEVDAAIAGIGVKSHDQLQHEADVAREAFEKVLAGVKTGQYTEADALKAEIAYQKAIAALGGEAGKAAEAWLRLHDAASAAGTAQSDAMKKAEKELSDLIQKRDSLAGEIAKEAPEEFIGVVEQQQRAELKALDDQIQQKADAYAKLAKDTGEAMADAIKEALERLHVVINVEYNLPDLPSGTPRTPTYVNGEAPEYASIGGTISAHGLLPRYFSGGGTMLPSLSIPSSLFVPRGEDRYPAMLAEGETVRTKSQEAALWSRGDIQMLVGVMRDVEAAIYATENHVQIDGETITRSVLRTLDRNVGVTDMREVLGVA